MNRMFKKPQTKPVLRAIVYLSLVFLLTGCAGMPPSHSMVDSLVITKQYEQALSVLDNTRKSYGEKNELLYLLDKGFIQHLTGDYEGSINTFNQAQMKFDELYTESIAEIAATWVVNDYAAAYHGEDFEHVFINIFQALNYLLIGKYDDALVEARDVDSKLNAINNQYNDDQKNVYKDDAFIRFLMGILYEAGGSRRDLNDAFIAYRNAAEIYEGDYGANYDLTVPEVVKENLLSTARPTGLKEYGQVRGKYKNTEFLKIKEKNKKAEVYLLQYNGLSPIKIEDSLSVPTLDGHIVKVAFPKYRKRPYAVTNSRILAKGVDGKVFKSDSELCQDIGAIAIKNLDRRKIRYIAKSTARATGRYLAAKKQEENIEKKSGNIASDWFRFFANMYNIIVEQADLRSWQTLPDQIRVARLLLEPGIYEFSLENFALDGDHLGVVALKKVKVEAGGKLFLIVHTTR